MDKGMKRSVIAVIINVLIFLGCILLLTRCASVQKPQMIVRAVAQELPGPSTRILVWQQERIFPQEENTLSENETIMWLQQRGLTVLERNRIHTALAEQAYSMRLGEDAKVLSAGKMLGAQQIVFLHADRYSVSFRTIDTETGRILWSGTGQWETDKGFLGHGELVTPLVRKTLDAVWASKK